MVAAARRQEGQRLGGLHAFGQANDASWTIAMVRIRSKPRTRAYVINERRKDCRATKSIAVLTDTSSGSYTPTFWRIEGEGKNLLT